MPHGSFWFPEPEYNRERVRAFIARLAEIADVMGYTTGGGPLAGRGNVRRLLEAIVSGEVILVRRDHNGFLEIVDTGGNSDSPDNT